MTGSTASRHDDVAVIGAGAAGLMTAIELKRRAPDLAVALLEGQARPGAKILVSGGGRCNVTNAAVAPSDFHGERKAIARIIGRLPVADVCAFFLGLGVPLRHEPAFGKLFPASNRARTVLEALLTACRDLGVTLLTGFRVSRLTQEGGGFLATADDGRTAACRRLVLATGGLALPRSGSDGVGYGFARALGHTVTPTAPALVPLVLAPHPFAGLAGVSFPAALEARQPGGRIGTALGPVLVTHFGLSGPAALDISRHWSVAAARGTSAVIRLSVFAGKDAGAVGREWTDAGRSGSARGLLAHLPDRVAERLVALAHIPAGTATARLTREARQRLATIATGLELPVSGTRGFREAEVTAGGVPLSEVDPRTMQSRVCPGLYLVGEILDVDGRLGGFNFHWAWATGHVAALALARAGMRNGRRAEA